MDTVLDPATLAALDAVADALPGGSLNVFDRHLRYVYARGSGLAEVGLSPDALVGRTLVEVYGAEGAALVDEHYRQALAGKHVSFDLDVFGRTYGTTALPFSAVRADTILVVVQDVTALRTEAGEHRQKEAFVATVAHELRQPLGPLRIALELLKADQDRKRTDTLLQRMERQVQQLERLVADLAHVGLPEGPLRVQMRPVDLRTTVSDAIQAIRHVAHANQQELTWRLDDAMPVAGDEVRLRQIFSNLLLNALKYTPSGGRIEVRGARGKEHVEVIVTDSGIGMAKELVPRVFELFVQGEPGRGGMGVGLNVVKRLVDAHGGKIDVHSDGPGRGSRFRVVLPAAEPC